MRSTIRQCTPHRSSILGNRQRHRHRRQRVGSSVLTMTKTLKKVYFDPRRVGSYGGVDALRRVAHAPRKVVAQWLSEQDAYSLHKPARRRFKRRRVIVGGRNQQWQADLVDLKTLKDDNDGMTFLLTMIDVFSKRAKCIPIPSKSAASLVAALRIAFTDDQPQTLQTDRGMEFLNKSVQTLLRKRGVHHFATHNAETKASIVERFNRTLKEHMWRYFTKVQSWRYIDVLPDLVRTYNTRHRSLGMAPSQVTAKNQETVWQRLYGHDGKGVPKLRVSDRVRISRYKRTFEKGYETNWSEEVFTVHEVHPSDPPVYRLRDDLGNVLEGTFYELELQKVVIASDKEFRVEAVLERRKVGSRTNALVKWFGYSSAFNSWIDARSLTSL